MYMGDLFDGIAARNQRRAAWRAYAACAMVSWGALIILGCIRAFFA